MSIYKKIIYKFLIFCLILHSFPLHALNPLFSRTITVENELNDKDRAILSFRLGLTLDEVAIKTLARSGLYSQARNTLHEARQAFTLALQLDPDNPLIQTFEAAHDDFIGDTLIPGDSKAKLALSFLYDGKADTNDEYEASLDDSHLSTFWLASKADPERALIAMAPKREIKQDNSHKKIQFSAVAAGSVFAGGLSYGLAHYLTEDVFIQYGSGAAAATFVVMTYLVGYLIASCCANRYGKTNALKKYQKFVKLIAEALPGGPKEVEVTIDVNSGSEVVARRRRGRMITTTSEDDEEAPSDVLEVLPTQPYFNDLAEHGTDGLIVQAVREANLKLRQATHPKAGQVHSRKDGKKKAGSGTGPRSPLLVDDDE